MNKIKIVNHFSNEDLRIGYEVDGIIPEEKGDMYCPSSPAEVEFTAYFINEKNEIICKVPDELVGYLNLEQRVSENEMVSRQSMKTDAMIEETVERGNRLNPVFDEIFDRLMRRRA